MAALKMQLAHAEKSVAAEKIQLLAQLTVKLKRTPAVNTVTIHKFDASKSEAKRRRVQRS